MHDRLGSTHVFSNILQTGTPLPIKGAPPPDPSTIVRERITTETIYMCIAAPPPDAISTIVASLLSNTDVASCLNTVNSLKTTRGLALADIVTAVADELSRLQVPAPVMISWLDGLAEVEYRVAAGGSEIIQTGALVGVVRRGAELMG